MGIGPLTSKGARVTWPLHRPQEAVAVAVLTRRDHLPRPILSVRRSAVATSRGRVLVRMNEATLATAHDRLRVAVKRKGAGRNTRKRTVIRKSATRTKRGRGTRMRNVAF
jgi:hypothetical protein